MTEPVPCISTPPERPGAVGPDIPINSTEPRTHKRPYKKSLSGCKACKARKVKCDERRPVCSNCKRRYVNLASCEYTERSTGHTEKSVSNPRAAAVTLKKQISIKPSGLDESNRLLELRLFYHYTISTGAGHTLKDMVPIISHSMWEIDIPQMAFSSPIVLNALLAISALNLLALQPEDQILALASRTYFSRALEEQRDSIASLGSDNAKSLLISAVLIAHHTWLSTHMIEKNEDRYNLTLVTYHMCQGIQTLIRRASPWLEKYSFTPESVEYGLDDGTPATGFLHIALTDMDLLAAHFYHEGVSSEDSEAYKDTANVIIKIYRLLMTRPLDVSQIEQAIVTILHRVLPRFIKLLEQEQPLAMALMARNLCQLAFVEDSRAWWIHGAGDNKVAKESVLSIQKLMPTEWQWAMVFPMNVISKEIKLDLE